jgi:hypothetical protein
MLGRELTKPRGQCGFPPQKSKGQLEACPASSGAGIGTGDGPGTGWAFENPANMVAIATNRAVEKCILPAFFRFQRRGWKENYAE